MKKFGTILLLGFFALSACDDASTRTEDNTSAKINEVENRAINGQQWRITNFSKASVDQTDRFAGYIFEFDSNNLLTSTNGSENLAGNWSIKDSGGNDESKAEFSSVDFSISFSNPTSFMDLSGNWKIASLTDAKIELRQANGDVIRLERI